MPEKRTCYRCGQKKVAILNFGDKRRNVEMVKMGYGKHRGQFRCKDRSDCERVRKK